MRHWLLPLLCIVVLLGSVRITLAQSNALTQMQLVDSLTFLKRVHYLAYDYAQVVLEELQATVCHSDRLILAREFLDASGPSPVTQRIAVGIVRNNEPDSVIVGTVVTDPNPTFIDSSASDLALYNAIEDHWNTIAKCATGL